MEKFEQNLQRRLAQTAITSSALRNQGEKGMIEICRNFCENLQLEKFFHALPDVARYRTYLDQQTDNLLSQLDHHIKSGRYVEKPGWGSVRKALNLFFAAIVSHHYFATLKGLPTNFTAYCQAVASLEVPLDSHVFKGLKKDGVVTGRWQGVKHLAPTLSDRYQQAAAIYAKKIGLASIHLDVKYWRAHTITL